MFLVLLLAISIFSSFICVNIPSNDSQVCSSNGNCTSADNCECNNGYYGHDCNVVSCVSSLTNFTLSDICTGRGMCEEPDICQCENGFYGSECVRRSNPRFFHTYGRDISDYGRAIISLRNNETYALTGLSYKSVFRTSFILTFDESGKEIPQTIDFYHPFIGSEMLETHVFQHPTCDDCFVVAGDFMYNAIGHDGFIFGFNKSSGVSQNFALRFGTTYHDYFAHAVQCSGCGNSDIFMIGRSYSWNPAGVTNEKNHMVLFRFGIDGSYVWGRDIGNGDSATGQGEGVHVNSDGTILLGGTDGDGSFHGRVFKLDSTATSILWGLEFAYGSSQIVERFLEIEDGYLITGYFYRGSSFMCFFGKVFRNGTYSWGKLVGTESGGDDKCGTGITRTSDGNYVVVGTTASFSEFENGFLVKFREDGNILWAKTFNSTSNQGLYDVLESQNDHGLILSGYSERQITRLADAAIRKVDEQGNSCDSIDITLSLEEYDYTSVSDVVGYVITNITEGEAGIVHFGAEYGEVDYWDRQYDFCDCSGIERSLSSVCNFLNGTCDESDGQCKCFEGYHEDCSIFVCFSVLSNISESCSEGVCVNHDLCLCNDGYFGEMCQFDSCESGYFGELCTILSCNGVLSNHTTSDELCNGRGNCVLSPDSCTCNNSEYFFGSNCEKRKLSRFDHTFGKDYVSDYGRQLVHASDGNYYMSGVTSKGNRVLGLVLSFSEDGNPVTSFELSYPRDYSEIKETFVFEDSTSNRIICAGTLNNHVYPGDPFDGYLIGFDRDSMEVEWGFHFGEWNHDYISYATQNHRNGDVVLVGRSSNWNVGSSHHIVVFRFTKDGDYVMGRDLGDGDFATGFGYAIRINLDGSVLIGGVEDSSHKGLLFKMDRHMGTIEWGWKFDAEGWGKAEMVSKLEESEEFYFVSGDFKRSNNKFMCFVAKFPKNGSENVWAKLYGSHAEHDYCGMGLRILNDGNILVVGKSESFSSTESGFALKLSHHDGSVIWGNIYNEDIGEGFYDILETTEDGSLLISGYAQRDDYADSMLRRVDEHGRSCDSVDVFSTLEVYDYTSINIASGYLVTNISENQLPITEFTPLLTEVQYWRDYAFGHN